MQVAAAAAAKLLQSCQTLCYPRDGSSPGSPIPGILQARTLEWVAISFSKMQVTQKPNKFFSTLESSKHSLLGKEAFILGCSVSLHWPPIMEEDSPDLQKVWIQMLRAFSRCQEETCNLLVDWGLSGQGVVGDAWFPECVALCRKMKQQPTKHQSPDISCKI